eukprot:2368008-Rhodomonas_salina.1
MDDCVQTEFCPSSVTVVRSTTNSRDAGGTVTRRSTSDWDLRLDFGEGLPCRGSAAPSHSGWQCPRGHTLADSEA